MDELSQRRLGKRMRQAMDLLEIIEGIAKGGKSQNVAVLTKNGVVALSIKKHQDHQSAERNAMAAYCEGSELTCERIEQSALHAIRKSNTEE